MAADQDTDRSHAATPHKLAEARKRGQLARSADVVSAIVLAAAVVYLQARGWDDLRAQFRFDRLLLAQAASFTGSGLARLAAHAMMATVQLLMPLLLAVMLAGVVGNLVQTGPVFAVRALAPDWSRLHPARGLRKLFSRRMLFDALRSTLKLALLGTVAFVAVQGLCAASRGLGGVGPVGQAKALLGEVASLGTRLVLAMGLVALLDWAYVRREYAHGMRMSHREVSDEHKHREGDPRVRARLRELRREMRKRARALRRTREADLLLANPTHCAVALRYEHGRMAAPQVVCKGAGALAAAMRGIAARHRVPVVRHAALARALYAQADIDQYVPPALYADVARLMVWLLAARQAGAAGDGRRA